MNTKKFTVASGLGDGSVEKTLATHSQDLSSYSPEALEMEVGTVATSNSGTSTQEGP